MAFDAITAEMHLRLHLRHQVHTTWALDPFAMPLPMQRADVCRLRSDATQGMLLRLHKLVTMPCCSTVGASPDGMVTSPGPLWTCFHVNIQDCESNVWTSCTAGHAASCAMYGGWGIHGGHMLCHAAHHPAPALVACPVLHPHAGHAAGQLHQRCKCWAVLSHGRTYYRSVLPSCKTCFSGRNTICKVL